MQSGASGRIARNKLFAAKPDGYTLMTEVAPGAVVDELVYYGSLQGRQLRTGLRLGAIPAFSIASAATRRCGPSPISWPRPGSAASPSPRSDAAARTICTSSRCARRLGLTFDIVHFEGASPAYAALLGGHVDVGGGGPASGKRQAGDRLRFLGLTAEDARISAARCPHVEGAGLRCSPGQPALLRQHLARRPRRSSRGPDQDLPRRSWPRPTSPNE